MLKRLNKLKGRSWTELRVRGAQALAAYSERHGMSSLSNLPTDQELFRLFENDQSSQLPNSGDSLLAQFRTNTKSKFFAPFDDRSATVREFLAGFGKERQSLIEQANSIIEGRFNLLGFRDLGFGQPINWHVEPLTGKQSPFLHWTRIDELESESGDKKIVWELNRHQYFATLGRAYWMTGDELYARVFAEHIAHWMDHNLPKIGINWISSLEVAFRAISWIWALHFFKESQHLTAELYVRVMKYLYLHARHLETYLSTYSSPNTHLTGEALGLFYLGTLLPGFRLAPQWQAKGKTILIDALSRHVLADGVYFERASYYHRYTTDFYTHFLILSDRNSLVIGDDVKSKLLALLDHLMYLTRPDGTTPFVGDDDGGRLAMLDERAANDFRPLLSTGAVIFRRADYKYVAGEVAESTLWLLGREALQAFESIAPLPPPTASRAFPDGGYYVMRDGWESDANYLLLDCGPHGVLNCGHAHADALSFELAACGRTMLVDPGTYTYTGSRALRDYFRSSAAHNTLTIDGESSSIPDGPFSWKSTGDASIIEWKSEERFDFMKGTHNGYKRLARGPATHTRSALFLKKDYWVIRDTVETDGEHQYDLHFHFAAGAKPVLDPMEATVASPNESAAGKSGLQIFSVSVKADWRIDDGWISSCYGERTQAPVCTFSSKATGSQEFFTFLIPRRANETRVSVREFEAKGGRGFEIKDKATYDLLLLSDGGLVETNRIATDFKWAWVRFASDGEALEELVLMEGSSFACDGLDLVNSSQRVVHVVARRNGDKLLLEIDERMLEIAMPNGDLVTV